jgi:hypothetical protein
MVPRWDEWLSVKAQTLVIYADKGMFSEQQKLEFVGFRPGTLRANLDNAGHDAHLDQFDQLVDTLRRFQASLASGVSTSSTWDAICQHP